MERRRRARWAVSVLVAVVLVAAGCSSQRPAPEPSTSTTSTTPDPARRAAHTATALGLDTVLVVGGCVVDGCTTATGSTALLDQSGLHPVAALLQPRDAHTATRLTDGTVLAVGGFGGEGEPPLSSAERYDPSSDQWTAVGGLRTGRGGQAAAALGRDQVLVAGGWIGPRRYTASTEIYQSRTRTFSPGPDLPVAVNSAAAATLSDGSVLVTGGQSDPTTAVATATLVSSDGRAQAVGPMLTARFKHTMVELADGEILVIGGTSDDERLLASTEIYDPEQRRFRPGPRLQGARYKLSGSASLLPDGRVLVAGGGQGAEVIDPVRRTSTPVDGAGRDWASFSTVSVVGPDAWIIGGYDRRIGLTGQARRLPLAAL